MQRDAGGGAERGSVPRCGTRSTSAYADKDKYPSSLEALVSDGYLRKIPEDPITKSPIPGRGAGRSQTRAILLAEPGVYDVKSGAEGNALDGSPYADW